MADGRGARDKVGKINVDDSEVFSVRKDLFLG